MFGNLLRRRAPKIVSTADLADFLDRRAALIAQKSVVGYCNVKTMLPLHELMKDQPFVVAFEISRWEAFAAALADLVVVASGYLRSAAEARRAESVDSLAGLYGRILARHPVPAHRADGWKADIEALRLRLATSWDAAPLPISEIAKVSALRIFETMPIHERLREPDGPAIMANVTFLMVGMAHEFEAQLDIPALVAGLRTERPAA